VASLKGIAGLEAVQLFLNNGFQLREEFLSCLELAVYNAKIA